MYKKPERLSPFHNPNVGPETGAGPSDLCLGVGSASPRELVSAAWIFACVVRTAFTVLEIHSHAWFFKPGGAVVNHGAAAARILT